MPAFSYPLNNTTKIAMILHKIRHFSRVGRDFHQNRIGYPKGTPFDKAFLYAHKGGADLIVGIQSEILKIHSMGLLDRLLADKTTKTHILWATDAYREQGAEYQRDKEITPALVTENHSGIIKNRARKALEQQSERTRQRGEVFTPLWICAKMNDTLDAQWFGKENVFFQDGQPTERVLFPKRRNWQHYIDNRRLELTCGEAPYLVSRYDVSNGESIPIPHRIGILDRKLRVVNENATDEAEWLKWVIRAYQSTYGYEFQGDNLLIARVNLLMTFEEYLQTRWNRTPTVREYHTITNIIAWNLWQMDGLSGTLPYCKAQKEYRQISLFEWFDSGQYQEIVSTQPHCRIYDWRGERSLEYKNVNTGGRNMKFSAIIGNPPYQDETLGDNKGFAPPIYHKFMESAYKVADVVELIHPARFLFNAGSTPKAWNEKMLNDEHFKVLFYESDASKIFPNTDIKGGVVISYYDNRKKYGSIQVFSPYEEMNGIMRKAAPKSEAASLMSIIYIQNKFNLELLYADHPEYKAVIGSDGKDKRFRNNIFDKIPEFKDEKESETDIRVIGVSKNKRQWKYISACYVDCEHESLNCWKVLVARVNGSGALGEVLSSPFVAAPNEGYTQTFIGIGAFSEKSTAENVLKYIKGKFARTMLSILKITQDNNRDTWKMVPLQDFTSSSDIDWSKSIAEIDQQLYAKYRLDEKEIEFIETHVKEMV